MASSIDTDSGDGLEGQSFDFIIIGGGTSGLAVACRLSEDADKKFLVLEAGANHLEDKRLKIPGLALNVHDNTDFDWSFRSVPQEQLGGRQLLGTKGKGLGGSSTINFGTTVFPSRAGTNAWESLGNPGWGWDNFEEYFLKFHTAHPPSEETRKYLKNFQWSQDGQGTSGPVQLSFGRDYLPYHVALLETFMNLGFEMSEKPLKGIGPGAYISPGTIDPVTHTRSHSGMAYYSAEAQKRPNLRVVTHAYVEKVLLEKEKGPAVATGVEALISEKKFTIKANKEVILAAGTSQTPQLLELSGIGDCARLKSLGIPSIVDNKGVGENVQDHGCVSFSYEVAEGMPSADTAREPQVAAQSMDTYEQQGRGPLSLMPCVPAFAKCSDFEEIEPETLLHKIKTMGSRAGCLSKGNSPRSFRKCSKKAGRVLSICLHRAKSPHEVRPNRKTYTVCGTMDPTSRSPRCCASRCRGAPCTFNRLTHTTRLESTMPCSAILSIENYSHGMRSGWRRLRRPSHWRR